MEKVEILLRAAFSVSHISANLKVKYFHIKHSFVIRNTQLWCFRVSWVSIFTNIASYMLQNHNLLISLHHIWVKWHTISAICKNFRGQCPPSTPYSMSALLQKVRQLQKCTERTLCHVWWAKYLYFFTLPPPSIPLCMSCMLFLHRWWHIWSHHWHR